MNNRHEFRREVLLPQNIMEAVLQNTAARIGVPHLAPHDLRRTFAKLAHKGRAALEQIQLSLGHASIVTTERYLGVRQDLHDAPCESPGSVSRANALPSAGRIKRADRHRRSCGRARKPAHQLHLDDVQADRLSHSGRARP
jgi:hypothetical protein